MRWTSAVGRVSKRHLALHAPPAALERRHVFDAISPPVRAAPAPRSGLGRLRGSACRRLLNELSKYAGQFLLTHRLARLAEHLLLIRLNDLPSHLDDRPPLLDLFLGQFSRFHVNPLSLKTHRTAGARRPRDDSHAAHLPLPPPGRHRQRKVEMSPFLQDRDVPFLPMVSSSWMSRGGGLSTPLSTGEERPFEIAVRRRRWTKGVDNPCLRLRCWQGGAMRRPEIVQRSRS